MQQELVDFYQFSVSRDPWCYLSSKKVASFNFLLFSGLIQLSAVIWEQVSILPKSNPAFYLVKIQSFLNFWLISRLRSAERIRGIG